MEVTIRPVGFDVVISKWRRAARQAKRDVDRTTETYAKNFLDTLAINASGRPGPMRITGSYLDSWFIRSFRRGTGKSWVVTTLDPRAKRLEYGFVGVDSLGRHYNQQPYPHVRVTILDVEPRYIRACRQLPKGWYR